MPWLLVRNSARKGLSHAALLCGFTSFTLPPLRAQSSLWEIVDSQPATVFGNTMRNVGDFDGDGADDFIVGAPGYNPGNISDAGRARIFSGSSQAPLLTILGSWPSGGLGFQIPPQADLNGDAVLDFVFPIDSPVGMPGGSVFRQLHLEIYSGLGPLLGSFPASAFAGLKSAAVGGDYDGDGIPDLLVGEQYAFAPGPCFPPSAWVEGRVRALSGFAGPSVAQWMPGTCGNEYMGQAIEPLGDITGDGLPDFVVGSRGNSVFPAILPPFPALRLYSGVNPTPVWTVSSLSVFPANDILTLALVGDTDGDGVQDIAVGNPFNFYSTNIQVFSGSSGALLLAVDSPYALHGRSIARIGDLDGDGLADVLAGAPVGFMEWQSPTPSPANWPVPFPNAPGRVLAHSGDPTVGTLLDLPEPVPPEGFGMSVVALGDLDGDDYPDFAASEPWRAPTLPGRVLGYSGAPVGIAIFGSGCPGSGGVIPRIAAWRLQPPPGPVAVTPGSTLRMNLSRALGGGSAILVLGASNANWGGFPLPFPLGFAGMPACSLLVSPDATVPVTTLGSGPGNGRVSLSFPIPPLPGLSGATIYGQWYVTDPGPGLLPGAMSRGIGVTIQ
ncbi:MAG: VCBS repeat-containing protein [Planctomycetes bacterium]|nr:VCBS repeat-containing protein [Planctomycetota bacterium]